MSPIAANEFSRIALLASLPGDRLGDLASRMKRETVQPGKTVVIEGEPGERFYVVLSGMLEVTQAGRGQRTMLKPGDYFGEVALAMDVPRTASVRAVTPVDGRRAATRRRSTSSSARCSPRTRPKQRLDKIRGLTPSLSACGFGQHCVGQRRPDLLGLRRPVAEVPVREARRARAAPRGRPRGTSRCRRSGRTSAASCACPSSAATSRRAARSRGPSRSDPPPEARQHADEAGERTSVASASVSSATSVGAAARARARAGRASVPNSPEAGEPRSSPDELRAARARRRAGTRRTASRRGAPGAAASTSKPGSSRSAARPAPRSARSPSNGSPDACASRWRTVDPGGPAGSSRSTTPSSAATSAASAATELRDRRPADSRASSAVPGADRRPARRTPDGDVLGAPRVDLRSASTARRY